MLKDGTYVVVLYVCASLIFDWFEIFFIFIRIFIGRGGGGDGFQFLFEFHSYISL